jgi:polysaccharide transporter, PST family
MHEPGGLIDMLMRAKTFLSLQLVRNVLSLYGVQFAQYLLPMVMIPYLARVLGPETWGLIVFVQAIGLYIQLAIEYAFELSGSRDVARSKGDLAQLATIVSGVVGAKLFLALGAFAIVAVAQVAVPQVRDTGWLVWLGAIWFAAVGLRPFWFFLGIERIAAFLFIEISLKAVAVLAILWFVNAPADAWMVLAFQAATAVAAALIGMTMVYRIVPFQRPSLDLAVGKLKSGWNLFVFRGASSVYNLSNPLILGLLAPAQIVGFYAGADRISRALLHMMLPVVTALYPRASSHGKDNPEKTARIARATILGIASLGLIACGILFFLAPLIIRVVLGPGYDQAVPVFRVLLLLLPILGVTFPLTGHWMLPLGLEKLLTKITVSAGFVHIAFAVTLGSQFLHVGIAWALVITEAYVLAAIGIALSLRRLNPFDAGTIAGKADTSWKETGP